MILGRCQGANLQKEKAQEVEKPYKPKQKPLFLSSPNYAVLEKAQEGQNLYKTKQKQ